LSSAALAILLANGRCPNQRLRFPRPRGRAPDQQDRAVYTLRRIGRGDLTAHGFRSTFRDWCARSETAFPSEVAEMALAHTVGDKVEAA